MSGSLIVMAIGAGLFIYGLFKKTEWIAIALFTAIVADVNFDLPVIPLNFRALTSILLLIKVMSERKDPYPSFFSQGYTWQVAFFIVYVLLISFKFGLFNMDIFKEFILALISAFLGYYFYFRDKGYKIFKISIILGGLICFGDLAYTYAFGGFPVRRFYFQIVGGFQFYNHNFFGYICGASFVFLLADYLNAETKEKLTLYLLPVMFLGTLISTSRSSLLMLFLVSFVLISKALVSQKKGKKAYTLVMITIACFFISLFIFQIAAVLLGNNSEFMTTMSARLIDEPVAMLNRALGKTYNANNLDSMDWRAEASETAYLAFKDLLTTEERIFGIGYNGFVTRDYGHGYDAHNGVLLMMIEFGVFGFLFYMILLGGLIFKAQRLKLSSPFVVCLIYMFLYVTSHNKELTAFFCFLVTGTLAAQIRHATMEQEEEHRRYREIRLMRS